MTPAGDLEAVSLAWEAATGCDSIAAIERVYDQTSAGAYVCIQPGCSFARRDPAQLWRHVHTAHGRNDLPPVASARAGYTAYRDAHNGLDEHGLRLPSWRDLDDDTRLRWLVSAREEATRDV